MEIKRLFNNLTLDVNRLAQPKQFRSGVSCPNLAPLKRDTVSFKGSEKTNESKTSKKTLKKDDFTGTDYVFVEKYKINPQQLKSKEQLQDIAKQEIIKIQERDFGGRQDETRTQRQSMLGEWFDYVIDENDAYSNTQKLVILSAITKDLRPNTDEIPEVLNKGVLAQTVSELEERLKLNPKENFDFNKMYKTNLRNYYLEDYGTGETMTGWVKIPSKKNDPENFEENVGKLKTLSHKSWCTKSFNAEPYLAKGDFHVYLENGQPKLGVRFEGKSIVEIQGEKNDGKIPIKYFEVFEKHITENKLRLSKEAQDEVKYAKSRVKEFNRIREELGDVAKLKSIDDVCYVLDYFKIEYKKTEDGLCLKEYKQPKDGITFVDLDIDENKIFKHVVKIEKSANFSNSSLTSLGRLKTILGSADFTRSQVADLGELETIGKDAIFTFSNVTTLGKLKSIGANASFSDSKIENLGSLEYIGGRANFEDSRVEDLGNLVEIGGNAIFYSNWFLTSLGNLEVIGGNVNFANTEIEDLGKLEIIGGNATFSNSNIKSLNNLKKIGKDANFSYSDIEDLGTLMTIGGFADFSNSAVKNLGKLEVIGDGADFRNTEISDLSGLEYVGGDIEYDDDLYEEVQELEYRSQDKEDDDDEEFEEEDFY